MENLPIGGELDINAPYLKENCPCCLGEGKKKSVDFDTMAFIDIACEECNGSGEIYLNKYDLLDKELEKYELYED